jgi:hypothetical protein
MVPRACGWGSILVHTSKLADSPRQLLPLRLHGDTLTCFERCTPTRIKPSRRLPHRKAPRVFAALQGLPPEGVASFRLANSALTRAGRFQANDAPGRPSYNTSGGKDAALGKR